MVRNPTLKSCLEEVTKKSISLLSDYFEQYIPKYNGSVYEHTIKNLQLRHSNLRISDHLFLNLISEKRDLIEDLKSYTEYLSTVTNDAVTSRVIGREIGIWGSPIFHGPFDYVRQILLPLLKNEFENRTFDDNLFSQEYSNIETFLYEDNLTVTALAPIYNLTSFQDETDLQELTEFESLSMNKINEKHKNLLSGIFGNLSKSSFLVAQSSYLLELKYKARKYYFDEDNSAFQRSERDQISAVYDEIYSIIGALRLIKSADVGIVMLAYIPEIGNLNRFISDNIDSIRPHVSARYELQQNELSELKEIVRSLKKPKDNNIIIAIDRYNTAYEKQRNNDKIIDLMIAYEAMFSTKNDTSDSVSHKLALRFSRWMASSIEDRMEKYRTMKDLYTDRSKIVHGSKSDIESEKIAICHELMRESLMKYLINSSFENHPRFIEILDYS